MPIRTKNVARFISGHVTTVGYTVEASRLATNDTTVWSTFAVGVEERRKKRLIVRSGESVLHRGYVGGGIISDKCLCGGYDEVTGKVRADNHQAGKVTHGHILTLQAGLSDYKKRYDHWSP